MKIAVFFSGQPRSIDEVLPYWKANLFDLYDHNLYIHTWFDYSKIGQRYRNSRPEFQARVLPDTLKILKEQYKPITMYVEMPKKFPTKGFESTIQPNDPGFIFSIQSMWYSIYKVCQLYLQSAELYHDTWIFRSRMDLKLKSPIRFEDLDPSKLYVFKDCKHTDYCLNDHFCIAQHGTMLRYCSLYVELYRLYESGIPFCSETLLGAWIKELGIETVHYPLKYKQAEFT